MKEVLSIVFLFSIKVCTVLGNWLLVIVAVALFGLKEIVRLISVLVINCNCAGLLVG